MKRQSIGVIGGMGPQASEYFYRLLIRRSSQKHCARTNDEYPYIHLTSLPVPDLISDMTAAGTAKKMILDTAQMLDDVGCKVICMACNTAHIYASDIVRVIGKKFISMPELVVRDILQSKAKKVLLLATPTTYKMGIYAGIAGHSELIVPDEDEQKELEYLIRSAIADKSVDSSEHFDRLIHKYKADTVLLGCTELPLIFNTSLSVEVVSSLSLLCEEVLRVSYGGGRL